MLRMPKNVDAATAADLMRAGALMVDVREAHEYAHAHIPGSHHAALSRLEEAELPIAPGQPVVFFCASGGRTTIHAARLSAKAAGADVHVMQGGISAWGRMGLPIESGAAHGREPSIFSRLFAR